LLGIARRVPWTDKAELLAKFRSVDLLGTTCKDHNFLAPHFAFANSLREEAIYLM
jgi:hypothetical protein